VSWSCTKQASYSSNAHLSNCDTYVSSVSLAHIIINPPISYNRSKNGPQECAHSFCLVNSPACMQGIAAGPAPKKTLLKRMGTGDTIAPALRKLFRTNRVAQTLLLLLVLMMTAMVIGDGVLTPAQTGRGLWGAHGRAQAVTRYSWLVLGHASCCAHLLISNKYVFYAFHLMMS